MLTAENIKPSSGLGQQQDKFNIITRDWLIKKMNYNAEKGILTWKRTDSKHGRVAKKDIGVKLSGRPGKVVMIAGKQHYVHRLVWIYHHGNVALSTHIKRKIPESDKLSDLYIVKRR